MNTTNTSTVKESQPVEYIFMTSIPGVVFRYTDVIITDLH